MHPTIKLLRSIGTPFHKAVEIVESEELYNLAFKNKIALLYLEKLKENGKLNKLKDKYEEHFKKYNNFIEIAGEVSKKFEENNINHIIFKTFYPFSGAASDIDILILGDEDTYRKSVETLIRMKYKPEASGYVDTEKLTSEEDYKNAAIILTTPNPEFKGGGWISPGGTGLYDPKYHILIDLQLLISLGHIIYVDKRNFNGHIIKKNLNNTTIYSLNSVYELSVEIAHSLTENLFLLSEFYAFLYTLSEMNKDDLNNFIKVINENNLNIAARSWIALTSTLCMEAYKSIPEKLLYLSKKIGVNRGEAKNLLKNNFKMPHRYSILTEILVFVEKFKEKIFRKTVLIQLIETIKDTKTAKLIFFEILDRRTKETYIHGVTTAKITEYYKRKR